MENKHKFPYRWNLADGYPAKGIKAHGCKVFGTFICGGGSSMGYKLAGYNHLGGVEIDPNIAEIYRRNHHPQYLYVEDLRQFNERTDLPDELYQLDLLDGSPPCSTFSMAGDREKAWGKEKQFAEGQKLQTLDDLVFVYCDTIAKLKPKTFILENVSGLAKGNAKSYLKRIVGKVSEAGFDTQVFVFNAATMGVPQRRERCFILGRRRDLGLPKIKMAFNEKPILFKEVFDKSDIEINLSQTMQRLFKWKKSSDRSTRDTALRVDGGGQFGSARWVRGEEVSPTLCTREMFLWDYPRKMNEKELKLVGSFPLDYDYGAKNNLNFLVGMSVPPVMTAQISWQMYNQWLSKL